MVLDEWISKSAFWFFIVQLIPNTPAVDKFNYFTIF